MAEGAVLVIGGCGFVGFHVVEALLGEKTWPSVHVMSRNPARNQLAGAFYHVGDMTSTDKVRTLLDEIRPSVIIHTASPVALGNAEDWQYWYRTNVGGTKNVLDCAAASTYVKAFVYTSSVSVIDKATFDYVDENAPMATITSKLSYYSKSKALADHAYAGHQRKQIGDNTNLYDACSVQNAATAQVLAAKALLRDHEDPLLKVDGEAFFITDGHPIPYWDFLRMIWAAAGDKTPLEEVQAIPAWFMLGLASAVEWVYVVFTLGEKRPKMLRRFFIEYTCLQRTFSIEKARKRLGYIPVDDGDGMIRAAVERELQKEVEAGKQKTS